MRSERFSILKSDLLKAFSDLLEIIDCCTVTVVALACATPFAVFVDDVVAFAFLTVAVDALDVFVDDAVAFVFVVYFVAVVKSC